MNKFKLTYPNEKDFFPTDETLNHHNLNNNKFYTSLPVYFDNEVKAIYSIKTIGKLEYVWIEFISPDLKIVETLNSIRDRVYNSTRFGAQ